MMRGDEYEILEQREIAGGGFDALARRRADGTMVRLWGGATGRAMGEGGLRAPALASRLAKVYQSGLPRVLEGFETDERATFVVQNYTGVTLHEKTRGSSLEIVEALDIAKSIGAALAKGHAAEILHGHVDEHCIFLHEDGRALLLYLGMSPFLASRTARAPEDLHSAPSETGDVFGLARVLFRLVTHQDPYDLADPADRDAALARGVQVHSGDLPPDIPEGLRRFLARSIHPDLSLRIRRAEEFAGDLRVLRASWDTITRSPEKALKFPSRMRAAAVIILAASAIAAIFLLRGCHASSGFPG